MGSSASTVAAAGEGGGEAVGAVAEFGRDSFASWSERTAPRTLLLTRGTGLDGAYVSVGVQGSRWVRELVSRGPSRGGRRRLRVLQAGPARRGSRSNSVGRSSVTDSDG
jgi:hypothetical protein